MIYWASGLKNWPCGLLFFRPSGFGLTYQPAQSSVQINNKMTHRVQIADDLHTRQKFLTWMTDLSVIQISLHLLGQWSNEGCAQTEDSGYHWTCSNGLSAEVGGKQLIGVQPDHLGWKKLLWNSNKCRFKEKFWGLGLGPSTESKVLKWWKWQGHLT